MGTQNSRFRTAGNLKFLENMFIALLTDDAELLETLFSTHSANPKITDIELSKRHESKLGE